MNNQQTYNPIANRQSLIAGYTPYISRNISNYGILVYLAALMGCTLLYISHIMLWYWWLFGLVEVLGFFYFANHLTKQWAGFRPKVFEKNIFWTTFAIRATVVLLLYWFHNKMTGQPFMYHAADALGYHEEAKWMASTIREGHFGTYLDYKFGPGRGVSDAGYPVYLGFVYLISNDSIIFARLLKSILGALTCVLIYRLGKRNFGEQVGRIAAILMMLEPHFSIYGGFHLKETEMVFMVVLFLERADNLVRSRQFNFRNILIVGLLAAVLFTFRTVLGLTAIFSLMMALMLSSKRVIGWGKRIVFLIVLGATALFFVGGRIANEIEAVWELREDNQSSRISEIIRTQGLAKYASSVVFAPMMFTIPFPTMVETENQEVSRMLHGGMMVKNIMSYFCLITIISLIFPLIPGLNKWRNHILIGVFLLAYLAILALSAFAHADRFHMPALAIEMLFVAYGVSLWRFAKIRRWFYIWCILMFIAAIGWNWFKLAGRGLA